MLIKKCCGFVPLRTATMIIGVLHLVLIIYESFSRSISTTTIIINATSVFTAILLIAAAYKRKRYYLLPWIVFILLSCITYCIMIFVALAFPEEFKQKLYNDKESEEAAELLKMGLAIFIAAFGVSIAIMLSFVWVVYSFFVELREEEENPRSRYQPDAKGYYPTAPA